ncbi:hypothetical protein WAI453_011412 [Rhynchosporium graminicola]|uniref:Uncharacterized protein n=1 Tax=Rhynchosporium graminicola TaxID=2792576 RepID=A0A1E1KBX0_9HELO|nr:uncharacterized protein RCO7_05688 [Rhynchosporium commune]
MRSFTTVPLLVAAYLSSFTEAQDSYTQSNEDRCQAVRTNASWFPNATYNASGSISIPGFRVNDTYPESTWTWSRYVINGEKPGNRTAISQTITLQTDPIQNLTDASSLPYTGCVFAFNDLSDYKNRGNGDDGTCSSVFTSACRAHILQIVTQNAEALSARSSGSRQDFSCPSLFGSSGSLTSDDSPCKDIIAGTVSSQFLSSNFTDGGNTLEPGCPLVNPGNSTLEDEPFFSWQGASTESGNFTLYNRAVLNALPVLMVGWLKETDDKTAQSGAVGGGETRWTDARLMCVSANQTRPGSRDLAEVERASGAGKIVGKWTVSGAVVMGLVVGLLP